MAENKKSFVLYCDLIHTIEKMPDDKAGLLFKHLLRYVNDQNPIIDDLLIEIAFEPIKRQLKRDLESWEQELIKKGNGGALGNLKRWHLDLYNKVINKELSLQKAIEESKNRIPSHSDTLPSHTIASIAVTDTVTVTVNDTVNDIKKINIDFIIFWNLYNHKVGSKTKAEKKWKLLKDDQRIKIIDTLPNFLKSITDKKFQPHALTYLNNERWEDELVSFGKKEYLLYSPQGKGTFTLTEDELVTKKTTGYWKEQHEI